MLSHRYPGAICLIEESSVHRFEQRGIGLEVTGHLGEDLIALEAVGAL